MKLSMKLALVAAGAAGLLSLGATAASAEVVCNADNECWHTHRHYDYRPEWGIVVHPDNWRWGAADHYRWHEHRGRGYWRNGVWIQF